MRGKLIGGYYPYNYEINVLKILNNFEKKNIKFYYPKLEKIHKWIFSIGLKMIL